MKQETAHSRVLSCGIIPVRKENEEWMFLLLRCFKYWDFPKGQAEKDEDSWQAALREFQEETGISKVKTPWKKIYRDTEVYSTGKIARYYIGEVTTSEQVRLLPNPLTGIVEHHEHRWVSYEEARKMVVPRVQKILDWAWKNINQ